MFPSRFPCSLRPARAALPVALALLALGATAQTAHAQTTFFGLDNPRGTLANSKNAESQFKAALATFGTDNLEAQFDNQVNPFLTFGATGVEARANNTLVLNIGLEAVSPRNALLNSSGSVFLFNQPIQAFGTFLIDLGNEPIANTLTFVLENTTLGTSKMVNVGTFGPNALFNNVAYFGVVDAASPFNRVTVQRSSNSDIFLYDDLTAGFARPAAPPGVIPEPGTLALVATGLLPLAGVVARRRRARG